MSTSKSILDITPIEHNTGRRRLQRAFLSTLEPKKESTTYVWKEYVNRETLKKYDYHHGICESDETCCNPNHMAEKLAVYSDGPKFVLFKGGEGGGKSVAGIIKDLERLRRGMSGIMGSPDFEHFKKSLWAEFRRWCPLEAVLERERYRLRVDWEPSKQFELHFHNEYGGLTTLYLGGFDDPTGWEGPNVNWFHGDELRRKEEPLIIKVLSGRIRIPGPNGEPPQGWVTTTPKMNWLYDYFGGVPDPFGNLDVGQEHYKEDDELAAFKSKAVVVSLFTKDNVANLTDDYVEDRGSTLTAAEQRVHLEAAWEDVGDVSHFLESHQLWDACFDEDMQKLGPNEPVVLAVDGAYSAKGDVFGAVAAGRHHEIEGGVAIRDALAWVAKGEPRDFDRIEDDLKVYCLEHAVTEIVYDPRELHQMMTRLRKRSKTEGGDDFPGVATTEFGQGIPREKADKGWLDLIIARKATHNGHPMLRKHVLNSDKLTNKDGKRLRIVKRMDKLKIDLNVCASMASYAVGEMKEKKPRTPSRSSGPFV